MSVHSIKPTQSVSKYQTLFKTLYCSPLHVNDEKERHSCIKMFGSLSGITLVLCMLSHLNICYLDKNNILRFNRQHYLFFASGIYLSSSASTIKMQQMAFYKKNCNQ